MNEPKWLTQDHKDLLTANGVDWRTILQKVANAAQILLQLITIFGGLAPSPKAGTAKATCDHHCTCCEVLAATYNAFGVAARHCCECCDGCC